jgi:NAD(P)-dependent dehydrogenase (short-subunit alcohol dehydrogenase family)
MNQVALITGASRGIGRGIALGLSRLGFHLILNYRSNEQAVRETGAACVEAALASGHKIAIETIQADVSNTTDRQRMVEFATAKFPRLDLLVNNAGMAPRERLDILSATDKSFDELIDVNLKGPFFLTQAVANWMLSLRKALGAEYRPKIITISSISAYTASTNRADYCISKAGLSMVTALFAARLAADGINVYEIRPGIIATDMTSGVK